MTLGYIVELARIVSKYPNPRKRFVLGSKSVQAFYRHLLNGNFKTDHDAAERLMAVSPSDVRYRREKSLLKQGLLDQLFSLDVREGGLSEQSHSRYQCEKSLFQSRILLLLGARKLAAGIAERALEVATRLELTSLQLDFLRLLREDASLTGSRRKFESYSRRLELTVERFCAEVRASGCYEELVVDYSATTSEKSHLGNKADGLAHSAYSLYKEFKTYQLGLTYHRLHCLSYQVKQDYNGALRAVEEALNFIQSNFSFDGATRAGEFNLKKLVCCIHSRDYENGSNAAKECDKYFRAGANNWFTFKEYEFLLLMHTGRYEEAGELHKAVTENTRFEVLIENRKLKWQLFYFYSLYSRGLLKEDKGPALDMLKRIPDYHRDKEGFNVALIICQILYRVQNSKVSEIFDHIEALKTYRYRYLLPSRNQQSSIFFQMLLTLEASSFNLAEARRRTRRLMLRLTETPSGRAVLEGTQILPYEVLWTQLLEEIDRQSKSVDAKQF